jgi:SmpA / OmlA family
MAMFTVFVIVPYRDDIMPKTMRLTLALAALLAGCASFDSLTPGTPAQTVKERVGAPNEVWKSTDGSEVWEYPTGPLGTTTYMVSFGPDQSVRQVRQVLTDENISKLTPGMQRDEVRRMLGKPGSISVTDSRNEEIWYWRYKEWQTRKMELYVQFDHSTGALKSVTRYQIDTSDGKRQ